MNILKISAFFIFLITSLGLMSLAVNAQPFNDDFANRQTIQSNISGSLADATLEIGEPILEGQSTGQTAWWTWTAPSNGIVSLQINGTEFHPLLSVYTGNSLENLSLISSNSFLACYENTNCGCHWRVRNRTTFHVQQGEAYQIAVDSALVTDTLYGYQVATNSSPYVPGIGPERTTNVVSGGNVNLQLQFTAAPPNDDFANRVQLRGSRTQINTANSGATKQTGEPTHLGNGGGSSVWYSWKAPTSGRVTLSINRIPPYPTWSSGVSSDSLISFSRCGDLVDQSPPAAFFPVFAAYTGLSVDTLTSADCIPMQLKDYLHAVEFDAQKGTTYQIAFDGNGGTTGETPLFLAVTRPAVNDDFKHRIKLNGLYAVAIGHNAGATHQAGEPAPAENSHGKSVWWTWRTPVSGTASISSFYSDHPFPMNVFTGTSISNLTPVAAGRSNLLFEASAGATYQISVADWEGRTGAVKLQLQGPEVELALVQQITSSPKSALLRYATLPGQIILLQRSGSDGEWKNVRKATARRNVVEFLAKPAPNVESAHYRAMVIADKFR